MTSGRPLTVSVVINTLNRANLLPNTLKALVHQDHAGLEVVVVNGPSTDHTEEVLAEWADEVKAGTCPEANLSMSRNIGIAMTSGDIVAFIDDDGVPEPEWLSQIVAAFDREEVGAAGGRVMDHTGHEFQYHYANADRLGNGRWALRAPSPQFNFPFSYEFPYLQGTNTAFRRSALLEIGGFDEAFVYYLDETDVCLRLIDRGYVVRQLHDAYVHHKYAPSYIRRKPGASHNRFPVLRSKTYFAHRHGAPFHTAAEIDADNARFLQMHQSDMARKVESGALERADIERFAVDSVRALHEGRARAQQPPLLLTTQLLEQHASPFKRFRTHAHVDKLTIAFLCEDYPPALLGGIARFTKDKATALAAMGHKVHVVARGTDHDTVDFEDGVWVHRIVARTHRRPAELAGLRLPATHWNQSQSFLDELDRITERRSVDLVEAPVWNLVGLATLLSGRYRLLTSLQTTLKISLPYRPDLASPERRQNFVEPIVDAERRLIQDSDGVVAISRGIADEVAEAYGLRIPEHQLHVCPLGMPDWADLTEADSTTREAGTNVLFVGRLETRKGIDLLLEVAPRLLARHEDLVLNIVGDDSIPSFDGLTYRKLFETTHPELVGTRVIFHGKVDEETLRAHYRACDVFVAPSRFESFGLIYLEAMMYAKPVVGCRAGGIPEVVDDEVTGLLVTPASAVALEEALERLISDPPLRAKLGRAGRLRYEREFTEVRMAEYALETYRAVLELDAAASAMLGRRIAGAGSARPSAERG